VDKLVLLLLLLLLLLRHIARSIDRSMRVLDICGFKFEKMFLEKLG